MIFKKFTVFPGQFIITSVPALISTVLGSCVSVCLWDPVLKIGGMNHYLLPGNADEPSNANRGMSAINMLVNALINRGAKIETLEAKVFGGCNSLYRNKDLYKVGERNISIAFEILMSIKIPIKAHHVGGIFGRKIVFNTDTGKVEMRLLKQTGLEVNEEINKGFGY